MHGEDEIAVYLTHTEIMIDLRAKGTQAGLREVVLNSIKSSRMGVGAEPENLRRLEQNRFASTTAAIIEHHTHHYSRT